MQITNVHPAKINRYCRFYQAEFGSSNLIDEKKDKPDFCNVNKITIKEE